ncbi:MAG: group 3/4 sigma-70 RNA polymerase sigma factor [Leptolyngbya sp. ERB_1_1]
MRSRQNVQEIFSTFLQFESDTATRWIVDARLRRNMQRCLDQPNSQELSELVWSLYWHKLWQAGDDPLAVAHLSAYLQEVCYWSARKLAINLAGGQSLADFFQIAIAKIHRVLQGFNPQQGSGLKRYASLAFSNIIKDTLRLRQEVDICTDWALLHKLSHKRFVESLRNLGLDESTITARVYAWQCFKAIYAPTQAKGSRKLEKPDLTTFQAVCDLYNRDRIATLSATAEICNPTLLEQWLTTCGKAARSYLYPSLISADTPLPGVENTELLDNFESTFQESNLSQIIEQEEEDSRQQTRSQLNKVLLRSLVKLDLPAQRLLQMYYGKAMTQQEIAKELDTKQYTVSRRLTSLKQSLLQTLAEWSQTELHQPLNSNVLSNMSTILEEWLKLHYSHPDLPS